MPNAGVLCVWKMQIAATDLGRSVRHENGVVRVRLNLEPEPLDTAAVAAPPELTAPPPAAPPKAPSPVF